MEPSDHALVSACRRGDEAAWEKLVSGYQRLIYSIPRRSGLDEAAASDVFQNVFASLVGKLDKIEQPDRIQAWLVTAAKRETWRAILHQKRFGDSLDTSESGESDLFELPDKAPLADEELVLLEMQHNVRTAVASLDDRCRELLTMLFYRPETPPYSEIATALRIPEGSIGPTRARCLKKLIGLLPESP